MTAVITGDLIGSQTYGVALLEKVLDCLKVEFDQLPDCSFATSNFDIYRGDSFQGLVNGDIALESALVLYAAVRRTSIEQVTPSSKPHADVRLSIGLGEVEVVRSTIAESSGTAFFYSGHMLDAIKRSGHRFGIKCTDEFINDELGVHTLMLDFILSRWSLASAEVVYLLLKGYKEQEIAYQLDISQPAVNLRKHAAGWEAIQTILRRYKVIINHLQSKSSIPHDDTV